jgi:hypothetical protein
MGGSFWKEIVPMLKVKFIDKPSQLKSIFIQAKDNIAPQFQCKA